MTKRDKRIERMRQNPKAVRFEELEAALLEAGFERRQEGGSHVIYRLGAYRFTIPRRRPFVNAVYVKQVLLVLDELGAQED